MKIKLVHKKLGRERAYGQADTGTGIIEVDPRLKGRQALEILIHESYHILNPEASETKVSRDAKKLANILWKENYRKVDNSLK